MAMRVAYLSDLNINNACLIYLQPYMGSFGDDVEMVELVGCNENVDQLGTQLTSSTVQVVVFLHRHTFFYSNIGKVPRGAASVAAAL
jgi:hypothetical protein